MKKPIFLLAFLLSGFVFETASAQLRVGVNINIGTQPVWGPVGYDYVEYYYLPDIDAYYYVPNHQYIYMSRGRWVFSSSLPYQYRNYDLYNGYKVVINEPRPYRNADMYRSKYGSYRGNHSQEVIRNSHDSRYFENRGHPEYNNRRKESDKQENGNQGNNGNRGNRGNNGNRGNKGNRGNNGNRDN